MGVLTLPAGSLVHMGDEQKFSAHAAAEFAKKYAEASSEKQLAQTFWRDLLVNVCGVVDPLAVGVEFEYPVRSVSTGTIGFIDVLWPGVLLVEHKSAGHDLDKAEKQARDYLISLEPSLRPPVIILCNFQQWRIVEVLAGTSAEFALDQLADNLHRLEATIGSRGSGAARVEVLADAKAAQLMAALFVSFEEAGYEGHEVSVFLVRVLFLLFGDDTRMWKRSGDRGLFEALVINSSSDGAGLGGTLQELFQILDTPRDNRRTSISQQLAEFPYVNGGLFKETLPIFSFTTAMREALVEACGFDYSLISVVIFGELFQFIKSKEDRRELGQHFTSEKSIMKVIGGLFLNEFNERLHKSWDSATSLKKFKQDLETYIWCDPACGAGNFILVAYKKLRELDLRISARLQELSGGASAVGLDASWGVSVHLHQFYGMEIDEWSSAIASVALFLAEHQANIATEKIMGSAPDILPLSDAANIMHTNALREDWYQCFPITDRTYIMGNPPFYGARLQTPEQKKDTESVWGGIKGVGALDYVSNWYRKAADCIASKGAKVAFVSTNSITQGEQPAIIWGELTQMGVGISFAHRTFKWNNDASGMAAVHTVIIGMEHAPVARRKELWDYETPISDPTMTMVDNINAYLLDAPDILITNRSKPLSPKTQSLDYGSQPNDDGILSNISPDDANEIRKNDPIAAKYLRRIVGAQELLHNEERYCLWLVDATPNELRSSPELARLLAEVRVVRNKSTREATRELAKTPHLFGFINAQKSKYLAVPRHSSENREYLPVELFDPSVIPSDALSVISDASLITFGVLSSKLFWVWSQAISGRLESRIRISGGTTYNNFPFLDLTDEQAKALEEAAADLLTSRRYFPHNSLADLYDPLTMPAQLRKAHDLLDKTVNKIYGLPGKATERQMLAKLFDLYTQQTATLFTPPPRRRRAAA